MDLPCSTLTSLIPPRFRPLLPPLPLRLLPFLPHYPLSSQSSWPISCCNTEIKPLVISIRLTPPLYHHHPLKLNLLLLPVPRPDPVPHYQRRCRPSTSSLSEIRDTMHHPGSSTTTAPPVRPHRPHPLFTPQRGGPALRHGSGWRFFRLGARPSSPTCSLPATTRGLVHQASS